MCTSTNFFLSMYYITRCKTSKGPENPHKKHGFNIAKLETFSKNQDKNVALLMS